MCNEYARTTSLEDLVAQFADLFPELDLFAWENDHTPNDLEGKACVRIRDTAPVFRLSENRLVGTMIPWAWPGAHGKPVFNFVTENHDFARADRVLVFADAFFEYTTPQAPKVKLKDRHEFKLTGHHWFWMAGIVQQNGFTLLTASPGPDVAPYHSRGIVPLAPREGLDWLTLARPQGEILAPPPAGYLTHRQVRKDGVDLAA